MHHQCGGSGACGWLPCGWTFSFLFVPDAWESRWVESKHKTDYGKFVLTAGKFYGDAEKDKGEWKGIHLLWICGQHPHCFLIVLGVKLCFFKIWVCILCYQRGVSRKFRERLKVVLAWDLFKAQLCSLGLKGQFLLNVYYLKWHLLVAQY